MIHSPVLGQAALFLDWRLYFFFLYPLYYALCIPGGVVFALDTLVILLCFDWDYWNYSEERFLSTADGREETKYMDLLPMAYEPSDTQA